MTHPIIKTDNYILITSDEEIKGGNYFYKKAFNRVAKDGIIEMSGTGDKKIIAHLPLNNEPILEGVPLLPPLPNEEDVNRLAEKEITFVEGSSDIKGMIISAERGGFVKGFLKAKEKYKFTEEDVRKFFLAGKRFGMSQDKENQTMDFDKFKQVYSETKLPVGFKCEMEYKFSDGKEYIQPTPDLIPKIINGVMQGEWIFE